MYNLNKTISHAKCAVPKHQLWHTKTVPNDLIRNWYVANGNN